MCGSKGLNCGKPNLVPHDNVPVHASFLIQSYLQGKTFDYRFPPFILVSRHFSLADIFPFLKLQTTWKVCRSKQYRRFWLMRQENCASRKDVLEDFPIIEKTWERCIATKGRLLGQCLKCFKLSNIDFIAKIWSFLLSKQ